jgi:3',5'-cyclic AMP phosphodiesterase CpdA
MFRLAHLTDPHVGPLTRPRLRQLLSKRATGYVNWQRGRKDAHDMEVLAALVADLQVQAHDHIACTGDLCNIGLPSEWSTAKVFLEALGTPEAVSFVPGNHDAYVRGSLEGLLHACGAWTSGDDGHHGHFPYLRRRGPVALIGLSSAIPTKPFVASGRLGPQQIAAAEALLVRLAAEPEPPCRVVMIHHPAHPGGTTPGRELKDAAAFTAWRDHVAPRFPSSGRPRPRRGAMPGTTARAITSIRSPAKLRVTPSRVSSAASRRWARSRIWARSGSHGPDLHPARGRTRQAAARASASAAMRAS